MFKTASFENEILESMEKLLASNNEPNQLIKASNLLEQAIDIFKKAELEEESSELSRVLEELLKSI